MLLLTGLLVFVCVIPVRLTIALYQAPVPQAIFVLAGDSDRTEFAAQFWQDHNNLDIWVSDYSRNLDFYGRIFQQFGVTNERLRLDGRATDTVTNFTTLVGDFVTQKLHNVYLITSDDHLRRAKAIATIVLGSRGIAVTSVEVSSQEEKSESLMRVLRDCGRSVLWVVTGRTGASLNPKLQ